MTIQGISSPAGIVRVLATVFPVLFLPTALRAQEAGAPPASRVQEATAPVVDTIIIHRSNVFPPEVADSSGFYRGANSIHTITKEWVIRKELLFEVGQPYDSTLVDESERNLRKKQIFRELSFDTTRVGDRLAVVIRTQDGWSLKPKFSFGVASDGTVTGQIGINDINLLGTGNQVFVAYQKQVDRDGLNLSLNFSRMLGSAVDFRTNYAGMSDGKNGNWYLGVPLRSVQSRAGLEHNGVAADQDVIRYRVDSAGEDSTTYRRQALVLDLDATLALATRSRGYLRAGITGEFRNEGYSPADTVSSEIPTIPDSLYGVFGVFVEANRSRFWETNQLNGFGTEDVDLSPHLRLGLNLAPSGLGYAKSGLGPSIDVSAGIEIPGGFVWAGLKANGLWNSAGLDSARALLNLAAGYKPGADHALVGQIQAGVLENTPPGSEFDLGYQNAPRSWAPHSFVGTRMVWGTFEYRWFRFKNIAKLFDVALAGFGGYGGAWYEDQDSRFGGNLGVGLRMGSSVATVATTGRLDFGWRFGNDPLGASEFVVSFGSGFVFPIRKAPVTSYTAEAPS